jgi:hypothetical protein
MSLTFAADCAFTNIFRKKTEVAVKRNILIVEDGVFM